MDLRFPLLAAVAAVAAATLPAQDPTVSQTFRSANGLDLELRYTALQWSKADSAKERPVGELRSRTPLTVAGQRVEQGSYRLVLALADGQPQLSLVSLRQKDVAVTCTLSSQRAGGPDRVSLALLPTSDTTAATLLVGFAAARSELDIGPAPRRGADDPALLEIQKVILGLKIDRDDPDWKMKLSMPPKLAFTDGKKYLWHLRTNVGEIAIELLPKVAPMHCSSTIFLTEVGFYDGIAFHRVIPRFMAQAGCPMGNGRGHPGYQYDGEFDPQILHDRHGAVSMANSGPGTDGSQFFITFGPTRHLDGKHTIFGWVVEGQDVVDKIEAAGSGGGQPTEALVIEESYITVQ